MLGIRSFLCALALLFSTVAHAHSLKVKGYARETLPGSTMSAAYLSLRNEGDRDLLLRGVELPGLEGATVELHTTVDDAGVSRMRPLASLAIPAGGEVHMAPGGAHLMLHGVRLRAGEHLRLRLYFDGDRVQEVEVPVRSLSVSAGHHH